LFARPVMTELAQQVDCLSLQKIQDDIASI
jgi:hypothetical protein